MAVLKGGFWPFILFYFSFVANLQLTLLSQWQEQIVPGNPRESVTAAAVLVHEHSIDIVCSPATVSAR
jgi:hypothetical protein